MVKILFQGEITVKESEIIELDGVKASPLVFSYQRLRQLQDEKEDHVTHRVRGCRVSRCLHTNI